MNAHRVSLVAAFALAGCATAAAGLYDSAPLHDPSVGSCDWSGRQRFVYQESDRISAIFEARDLEAYRRAIPAPLTMPGRPLIRVSVIDFYEMASGPTYLESEVSVVALNEGQPGWFVLTLPVTDGDSCGGGRRFLGFPKVVRQITLDRLPDRYVGVSYAPWGRKMELTLILQVAEPGPEAREVLREVAPFPTLTLKDGRVLRFGGGNSTPAYELERVNPAVWKAQLGHARLEFPHEPESLLHRLGVGQPLAAYWVRFRARYAIRPR